MQAIFDKIDFCVGSAEILENMTAQPALPIFSEQTLAFLNALSARLMKSARAFPDVITFAFWCRRAALLREKQGYDAQKRRIGRGISFHIAPSNVPINCAFTMAAGLLAGNATIVRLPSKESPQTQLVAETVRGLLDGEYPDMAPYVALIRYHHDADIMASLSAICDTRVIWGGDDTIRTIRQAPLSPRATEITFADRYSMCVIDADGYLALTETEKDRAAADFYNDTYLSDQNACTSPRLIVWLGVKKAMAKEAFWAKATELAKERYPLAGVQTVGKLTAFYTLAAEKEVQLASGINECYAMRVRVTELAPELMDYRYDSGYFLEYDAAGLEVVLPMLTERLQTVSYLGMEGAAIAELVCEYRPRGADRIVPMGQTMEIGLFWDGYDLIERMSRRIEMR